MGTEVLLGAQDPTPSPPPYCTDGVFKVRNVEIIVKNVQVVPVATIIPGAELLVEIVPDRYGFSDICSWRWSEQNGCREEQQSYQM